MYRKIDTSFTKNEVLIVVSSTVSDDPSNSHQSSVDLDQSTHSKVMIYGGYD